MSEVNGSLQHTRRPRAVWPGAALVVVMFGLPLFWGLDHRDQHNDEASYSYGVQHILETGEWLTVHGAPNNPEFLEKPPLKFWLVAAGIKSGLLPNNDIGLRAIDALFGATMFVYVYLIGVRIRGPWAGLVAALVLFTFDPLILEHGLRSNNMEAALVLAYCAGFYHFLGWVDAAVSRARSWHALAAAVAFVLGFMTKFVVAGFLPMGALVLLVTHPKRRELLSGARMKEWLWPAAVALLLIAPWFMYQTWRMGADFWQIILGQQVLERMSSGLDRSHIEPPLFYVSRIWDVLSRANVHWIVAAAMVAAVVRAAQKAGTHGRMILVWSVVPLAIISLSHSKIIHYAYPFLPPIALAAGWLIGDVARWLAARVAPGVATALADSRRRRALFVAGQLVVVLGGVTLAVGRLVWNLPGGSYLSNGSVLRPLLIGGVLMWLATRQWRVWLVAPVLLLVAAALPFGAYINVLKQTDVVYRPLAAVNECLRGLRASGALVPAATELPAGYPPTHAYYFYLREFGPYRLTSEQLGQGAVDTWLAERLNAPSPSMAVFKREDYWNWRERVDQASTRLPALIAEDNHVLVLPATAASCMAPAIQAGAQPVEGR